MVNSYRKLFALHGALAFSAAAFLGRLPAGMIGLAIILPISMMTGSYTIAGAVAASTMIGMAVSAPVTGRLVDRYGQFRILLSFAVLNLIFTTALIASIQLNIQLELMCLISVFTGASRLSTGTLARVRWAYIMRTFDLEKRKAMLQTAYSFEGVVDEIVFISAPILAAFLCTAVHPMAGLVFCLVSFVVGAVLLAVQRGTQPAIHFTHEKHSSAFFVPGLRVIFMAILFIGISAGAVEVIVVARAADLGSRSLAGLLLATLAFSSVLAGFWYGSRHFQLSPQDLWLRCLGLLVLALIPFTFVSNLLGLVLAMFIAGLSIAPTSIAGQVLTERILPPKLLNEGMNIIVTAMILGMAVGGWLSGILIDELGAYRAGLLPMIATFTAFIVVVVRIRKLHS